MSFHGYLCILLQDYFTVCACACVCVCVTTHYSCHSSLQTSIHIIVVMWLVSLGIAGNVLSTIITIASLVRHLFYWNPRRQAVIIKNNLLLHYTTLNKLHKQYKALYESIRQINIFTRLVVFRQFWHWENNISPDSIINDVTNCLPRKSITHVLYNVT